MKNRLYLLVSVSLLLLSLVPGPFGFPGRATAQSDSQQVRPARLLKPAVAKESPADSDGLITAIFSLQSDPVITHESSQRPPRSAGRKIELQSTEALQYEARLQSEQRDFESAATSVSSGIRVRAELRKLANAVAIEAPASAIGLISSLPQVKSMELSKQYHALLDKSVPLINAPAVWSIAGGAASAGKGVKIAILDTGIDISNPLFADGGFTAPNGFPIGDPSQVNNKVIVAKAFLNGDSSAADGNGHGTNVAGIAAGDFNTGTPLGPVSGVAPGAFLGNYRVLDASGSGTDFLVAQGLEEAVSDGFDIASLSLGATAGSTLGILDTAVESAVSAGMVVVVAAGNDGDTGAMTIDSPGVAPHAITVAASSNGHVIGPTVEVVGAGPTSAGLQKIESTQGQTCSLDFPAVVGPLSYIDEATIDKKKRACKSNKLPDGSMTGKIALIQRGICNFSDKINNVTAVGAVAAIIYNKDISEGADGGDNLLFMDVTGTSIPSVFITRTNGLALRSWIAAHPGAQIQVNAAGEFSDPPDILGSFSSRGPTSMGVLKPDLAAPGVNIYSGAIKTCNADGVSDPSGFVAVSGTSQATPHVAGSAALLKQLHPDWTPDQVKSALVNSADGTVFTSLDETTRAGVLDDGTGRVNVAAAASIDALFSPSGLSFGVDKTKQAVTMTANLQITSLFAGQNTFSITIGQTNPDPGLTLTSSSSSVSLAKGASATLTITLTAAKSAAGGNHTGYVVVTGPSGKQMKVPFWIGL
jgi:subtilisin family serine protease